jgi:DNA repair protein RadC
MTRQNIYRVKVVREGRPKYCEVLSQPQNVYDFLKREIGNETREVFVAIFLNTKNVPLHWSLISIGTLSSSVIHPREAFAPGVIEQEVSINAVAHKAAAIIIAHNHPSGDPTPSPEDTTLTQRLVNAGEVLGIAVLDHLILGDTGYFSFKEEGLLR